MCNERGSDIEVDGIPGKYSMTQEPGTWRNGVYRKSNQVLGYAFGVELRCTFSEHIRFSECRPNSACTIAEGDSKVCLPKLLLN